MGLVGSASHLSPSPEHTGPGEGLDFAGHDQPAVREDGALGRAHLRLALEQCDRRPAQRQFPRHASADHAAADHEDLVPPCHVPPGLAAGSMLSEERRGVATAAAKGGRMLRCHSAGSITPSIT